MTAENENDHEHKMKRRYKEFIELMPLTIAIAGLPENPGPRSYGTDQMEARAQVLQSAFKVARKAVRDAIKGS
jgi:hypothetical protein